MDEGAINVLTPTRSQWKCDSDFADYLAGADLEPPDENATAGVVIDAERKCTSSMSTSIATTGFLNVIVSMVTESAKSSVFGIGSVRSIGIVALKTAAGILACAVVGIAAIASGIIALAGFGVCCLCRK